ncbi:putative CRISPR-associated protein, APE2256 family [Acidilobus saccharovorans 345-15]|uniref:Putative CRISPR-associated protein, APE2256 family n=2 Tax=Acidilobus TaxID=105850 RepID=D9PZD7_ACIS3|nr:putative CRISPR-associated protein, APE2256 family [Acidilobus saccharovorans 345-15]
MRYASRSAGLSREQAELLERCSRLDVDAEDECERLAGAGRSDPLLDRLRSYLSSSPYEASAELNSLQPFLEAGMVQRVVLYYYSDSGAAHLVALLLTEYLKRAGVAAEAVPAGEGERNLAAGLLNIMREVGSRALRDQGEGYTIMLNITPGFKAEAAYFTLGLMLRNITALAYYRHEAMKSTVGVPLLHTTALRDAVTSLRAKVGARLEDLDANELVTVIAARLNSGRLSLGPVVKDDLVWAEELLAASGITS